MFTAGFLSKLFLCGKLLYGDFMIHKTSSWASALIIMLLALPPKAFAQNGLQQDLTERFVRYAKINTQSEYDAKTSPSSEGQKTFAKLLAQELKDMGASNVRVDENYYVFAEIPATVKYAPVIFLSSHMDTTPDEDLKGKNPVPVVHGYKSGELKISDKYSLTPQEDFYLASAAGGNIITSDGNTIIGGDDKAGVSVIMTIADQLIKNKKLKHGTVKIIFTTDEETGDGTKHLTKDKIAADYGLVLDGRGFGRLATENFNAADFRITVKAPPAGHPGAQTLPSASFMKDDILQLFPRDLRPYTTKDTQGYASYYKVEETGTQCTIFGRIREHDTQAFESLKDMVSDITAYYTNYIKAKYKEHSNAITISLQINDSYKNSKEILKNFPDNYNLLLAAYQKAGVTPKLEAARGGSDANDITFMGVPAYNLFAGFHNEHSPKEWVSSIHMQGAFNVVMKYIEGWAEKAAEDYNKKQQEKLKKDIIKSVGDTNKQDSGKLNIVLPKF